MDALRTHARSYKIILLALMLAHGVVMFMHVLANQDYVPSLPGVLTLTLQSASRAQPVAPSRPRPVAQPKAMVPVKTPVAEVITPVENVTASAVSSEASTNAHPRDLYLADLRSRIEQNKQYPLQAKRLGQGGIVEVSFTVTADGHIMDARVTGPSPFSRLNDSALQAVNAVRHFRPIPPQVEAPLDVIVPVRYSL